MTHLYPPCDALPSHLADLCCGESPRFTARQCLAHANAWRSKEGLPPLEIINAEPTAKVHAEKLVKAPSPKQAKAKPSILAKAASLGKAMLTHAKDRFRTASAEEQESRLVICRGCEKYEPADGSCKLCGCCMKLKTRLRTGSCPIGKWGIADARPAIHADAGTDPQGMREDPGGMDGGGNAQASEEREPTRQAPAGGVAAGE
jgi:hypothetical protein